MKKITALFIALMVFCGAAAAELPSPPEAGTDMILGEYTGGYYSEVTLYYEAAGGMELTGVTQTVYVPVGGSTAEAALDALFAYGREEDYISVMPGDAYAKSIDVNCGIATVDLSVNLSALRDESELVLLVMAVTNTLTGIDGIDYVNVLINGRPESVCSLPLGVLSYNETAASTVWSVLQVESEYFGSMWGESGSITRDAVLYFPSVNGQWVLPEVRTITFTDDNYAYRLISELMAGPEGGDAYSLFIASGAGILASEPEIVISGSGQKILVIDLNNIVRDYLLLQGIADWQFAAAVTMTLTSFVPEADAVCIKIDGTPVTQLNIRGQHKQFDDGCMTRSMFSMYAGSTCRLYFANEDGKLCAVQRAISSQRADSPYALIIQLIAGPSSSEEDYFRVMPAGITAGDLLGVEVKDGIACVNMSANFYRLCQALNPTEERLLVYAIVNTLCELPDIDAVSFRIEGETVYSLAGEIYLKSDLMMDPSIITVE